MPVFIQVILLAIAGGEPGTRTFMAGFIGQRAAIGGPDRRREGGDRTGSIGDPIPGCVDRITSPGKGRIPGGIHQHPAPVEPDPAALESCRPSRCPQKLRKTGE